MDFNAFLTSVIFAVFEFPQLLLDAIASLPEADVLFDGVGGPSRISFASKAQFCKLYRAFSASLLGDLTRTAI